MGCTDNTKNWGRNIPNSKQVIINCNGDTEDVIADTKRPNRVVVEGSTRPIPVFIQENCVVGLERDVEVDYVCNEATNFYDKIVTIFENGVEVSSTTTPTTYPCDEPKPDFEKVRECSAVTNTIHIVTYSIMPDGTEAVISDVDTGERCNEDTFTTVLKVLCDVQADASIVKFLRKYRYNETAGTVVVTDTTLDGSTAYVPTGTVSKCEDDIESTTFCHIATADNAGIGFSVGDELSEVFISTAQNPNQPIYHYWVNESTDTTIFYEDHGVVIFGAEPSTAEARPCNEEVPDAPAVLTTEVDTVTSATLNWFVPADNITSWSVRHRSGTVIVTVNGVATTLDSLETIGSGTDGENGAILSDTVVIDATNGSVRINKTNR